MNRAVELAVRGQVRPLIRLGDDPPEVAHGLMQMQPESEPDRRHGLPEHEGARAAERRGDGRQDVRKEHVALGEHGGPATAAFECVW